ncbi:MAG: hypothetical protein HZB67_04300 [Candidatus Aenigmarchaeota archaeon]|nr:hypothetical protein [Candidatus Aenigmarchaeota archaeon]
MRVDRCTIEEEACRLYERTKSKAVDLGYDTSMFDREEYRAFAIKQIADTIENFYKGGSLVATADAQIAAIRTLVAARR